MNLSNTQNSLPKTPLKSLKMLFLSFLVLEGSIPVWQKHFVYFFKKVMVEKIVLIYYRRTLMAPFILCFK